VAEALLGEAAEAMLVATTQAGWRIYASAYVLDEVERVLVEGLGFRRRLAASTRKRIMRRAAFVDPAPSRHVVASDPKDSPIVRGACPVLRASSNIFARKGARPLPGPSGPGGRPSFPFPARRADERLLSRHSPALRAEENRSAPSRD